MFFAPTVRTTRFVPRSLDRGFERFVNEALVTGPQRSLQVTQDDSSWTLNLDVPGLSRDDLTIGIEGTVLRIESKADAQRQLKLAYELPQAIDAAASTAKLENGVLSLQLGKQRPASQVHTLTIQ